MSPKTREAAGLQARRSVTIHMPCGWDRIIQGPEDFPLQTVPCLCHNPAHFFVWWADA